MPVYNCAAGKKIQLTIKQLLDMGIHGICKEVPMEHMVWRAGGGVTTSKSLNLLRLVFYQLLPSTLLDTVLKLRKQQPRLVKDVIGSYSLRLCEKFHFNHEINIQQC